MSCSPCPFFIPNCTIQQSRSHSLNSGPCSRASNPYNGSTNPCCKPSNSCQSYVCCYPCPSCACSPCVPCSPTIAKRKEKISDFIGSGVGAAPESDNRDKRKQTGRRNDNGRNVGKRKWGDEGEGKSGGGFKEENGDKVGESTGNVKKGGEERGRGNGGENTTEDSSTIDNNRNKNKKGNGKEKGSQDKSEDGKIKKGKGKKESSTELGKDDKDNSQGDMNSKIDTHGATTHKASYADIGVCTPKLTCVCPNPHCPSNLRKIQGRPGYSYASQVYGQTLSSNWQNKLPYKANRNLYPYKRIKKPIFQVPKKKTQRKCPICGKRKRIKAGSNSGQCGENYSAYYVKNNKFTAQSGLSS